MRQGSLRGKEGEQNVFRRVGGLARSTTTRFGVESDTEGGIISSRGDHCLSGATDGGLQQAHREGNRWQSVCWKLLI